MHIESAKTRIFFTFISNMLRGGFSFLAGLIVARGLGPNLYGEFIFLIASFAAIRQVLDLGTSSAFYTFLSNGPQGLKFLTFYLIWQLVQFLFPIIIIGLFLPEAMLNQIWLGEERELILLSFMAVFMKEQAWNTMVHLGESNRLTIKVQFSNILIAITHLLIISLLWITHFLSIQMLFVLIISEYVIACLIAFKFLYVSYPDTEKLDGKTILKKYYTYCIPLVFSSILGFIVDFSIRWMLQKFGGSEEQAYYGIGYQFVVVSILLANAQRNIFWKEISEAYENGNMERVRYIYKKTNRFLYWFGISISCVMIFWAEEIISLTFGPAYLAGSNALIFMFIYAGQNSLGIVTGVLLLATEKTQAHFNFNVLGAIVGLPLFYFLVAPKNAMVPGLELGAMGAAMQLAFNQFLNVNLKMFWIDKSNGWKFDWQFQFIGLGVGLTLAWLAYFISGSVSDTLSLNTFCNLGLSLIIYLVFKSFYLWNYPSIAGLTREEIKNFVIDGVKFLRDYRVQISNKKFV